MSAWDQHRVAEALRRGHTLDALRYAQAAYSRMQSDNLRTPRPAYASDPSIIEGEFKVVSDGR